MDLILNVYGEPSFTFQWSCTSNMLLFYKSTYILLHLLWTQMLIEMVQLLVCKCLIIF